MGDVRDGYKSAVLLNAAKVGSYVEFTSMVGACVYVLDAVKMIV
jgi:hypothetical protein